MRTRYNFAGLTVTYRTAMTDKGVLKAGYAPTLLAAFFYFDMSFMVWVILGSCLENLHKDRGNLGTDRVSKRASMP
jgi:nitrate/nitrite transporter NarK